MNRSSKTRPCPVCGRTSDGDCRFNHELILCHRGKSHGPPSHLRIGDSVLIEGSKWILSKEGVGHSGNAALFLRESLLNKRVPKLPSALRIKKQESAEFLLNDFFHSFGQVWEIPLFEYLPPDALKRAFEIVNHANDVAARLIHNLPSIWLSRPDLRHKYESLVAQQLKSLRCIAEDMSSFRLYELGECPFPFDTDQQGVQP